MHRVELKGWWRHLHLHHPHPFLMHRVELKVPPDEERFRLPSHLFLMHRVELKVLWRKYTSIASLCS